MSPTIGRIVHYRLSAKDAENINRRRDDFKSGRGKSWVAGAQAHVGNFAGEGDVLPLIVTAVWPTEYASLAYLAHHEPGTTYDGPEGVNGQVLLDGNDSLWVTSAPQHATLTGCWSWPPRT